MAIHIQHKNCGWLGRRRFYIWCAAQSRPTLRRWLFIKNYAVCLLTVFAAPDNTC